MKKSVIGILSGVALATSGMVLGLSNPASAQSHFDWTATGINVKGNGTFTTIGSSFQGDVNGSPPYPLGQYFLITDITGSMNGLPITMLLPPGTCLLRWCYGTDNYIYQEPNTGPSFPVNQKYFLTGQGVGFFTSCLIDTPPIGNVNMCGPYCPPEVCPPNGMFPPDGYNYVLRAGDAIVKARIEWLQAEAGSPLGVLVGEGELSFELVARTPEPSSLLGYIALGGLMLGSAIRRAKKS